MTRHRFEPSPDRYKDGKPVGKTLLTAGMERYLAKQAAARVEAERPKTKVERFVERVRSAVNG